jgi:4-amino-4-deoxy-L-arabinose transferase-like glycosyltransferase
VQRATRAALTNQSQAAPETPATTLQRIGWALLIAATLYICYFSNLNVIGFVGPDEPRYAWIARDMAESGDWVTPRLYGHPWFEKPPLLYWGGAIFFKLIPNQPEIAARLPSAISALLATLAMAWLAWRTYGEECARWLLLLLPASVGMIGFSHACATDMPFAGTLTIALVCAAVILGLVPPNLDTPVLPRTPWLALLLFGFFLGLAVLAKGPAALILAGGAVFLWSLSTKRWRVLSGCSTPPPSPPSPLLPCRGISFAPAAIPIFSASSSSNTTSNATSHRSSSTSSPSGSTFPWC